MRKLNLVLIFLSTALLMSCATGKKALQKGNYSEAVFKAIERLRSNPDSKNASQTLKDAYPLAIQTLESEIDETLISNTSDKYAIVASKYQLLNDMAKEIRRSPVAKRMFPSPKSYSTQLSGAKDKAAEESYQMAKLLLSKDNRDNAIDAFHLFEQALSFSPGYKDARKMMQVALDLATIKVAIDPINVPSRYKLNADFFADQIAAFLNDKQEFVAFLNPEEVKRAGRIDQILRMQFIDFNIGATKDKQKESEVTSKDSVKVGSTTVNGKKIDVFNNVTAKLTSNQRQVSSSGILEVKIVDVVSKKILAKRNIPGTYVWETEWASYNGDKRALTKEQLNICQKKPANPPNSQDLFYEFTKPIFNQTKNFLRNYYRQY